MGSTPAVHAAFSTGGSSRSDTTIVVGVDGSEPSWSAFWWACGEAGRVGGRVIAVHVSGHHDTALAAAAYAGMAEQYAIASEGAKEELVQQLEAEVAAAAVDAGISAAFLHLEGDTAEQLLRVAHRAGADMIVVGRSARAIHRLAGSFARRLNRARDAPIVVIVP